MSTKDWIELVTIRWQDTSVQDFEGNLKLMDFRGSMYASMKLKGIDGRAHQEWRLRLNLTQHGKTYQDQTLRGMTG